MSTGARRAGASTARGADGERHTVATATRTYSTAGAGRDVADRDGVGECVGECDGVGEYDGDAEPDDVADGDG